ncbi:ribose 5-phosphate isomerase B [Ilyobacter sp.]|jgi:ribose 5-phosphate isomerase B|uniref:ribose 5-phosphate isomerase B n=1 Tax=Ilyobacter sp. TaxID=3100343 RepID=UPI00356A4ED1
MIIALGADHGGFQLKEKIKEHLIEKGHEILDLGSHSEESVDYPEFGRAVGEAVLDEKANYGIIVCGTGIGISISANRIKGVRAALCTDSTMARLTRQHNDANVLALGARIIGDVLALDIVDTFLATEFEGGRHAVRIGKIEEKNCKCGCKH